MHTGTALVEAAAKVIDQGKLIASHVLEAAAADIEFKNGRFVIAGTDRAIGIMELAAKLRSGINLPEGVPTSLDVNHVSDGPSASAYPNGCHVCEVEIDPETGVIEVVKYSAVNDFGTVVNPMIVEGQLHGGVVQGIGQALMEMHGLRQRGPAPHRLLHGLRDAARGRRADVRRGEPSGAGQDQSARRQGLRRSRLRRLADLDHERGRRRAVRIRHPPYRHAGDAATGSGRRSRRGRRGRRDASAARDDWRHIQRHDRTRHTKQRSR